MNYSSECDCGDYCEWCHPELIYIKELKMEQEGPVDPKLVKLMNDIGKIIWHAMRTEIKDNKDDEYGFALFMFETEAPGRMNYISNCNREDMLVALKEFIARAEQRYQEPDLFTKKKT